jgi:hypothetical protein
MVVDEGNAGAWEETFKDKTDLDSSAFQSNFLASAELCDQDPGLFSARTSEFCFVFLYVVSYNKQKLPPKGY